MNEPAEPLPTNWDRVREIAREVIRYAPKIESMDLEREVTRIIALENARAAKQPRPSIP